MQTSHTTSGERPQFAEYLARRSNTLANGHAPEHEAVRFLKRLGPSDRHNLVAFDPEKRLPPEGKTFGPGQWAAMIDWIDAREGRLNLHFSVNEPKPSSPDKKLADRDIGSIRCIVVDLDPTKGSDFTSERDRLRNLVEAQLQHGPTLIDSGGGYQLLFHLEQKLEAEVHASTYRSHCRGLVKALGGDPAAIDPSRVLRLPGTRNMPDAKKRLAGRRPAEASLLHLAEHNCTLAAIASAYPPVHVVDAPDNDDEIAGVQASMNTAAIQSVTCLADLDDVTRARVEEMIATDDRFRRLWAGDPSVLGPDKSGSGFRAKMAAELGRAGGFNAQQFGEILHAWPHAVLDGQDILEIVTARTVARDWARFGTPNSPERWFGPIAEAPPSVWDAAPAEEAAQLATWPVVTAQDAARNALNTISRPLVKGLLDAGALSVLYGPSSVGKTFVALDIAAHVAAGLSWAGMKTTRCAVLYIAAEGSGAIDKRSAALGRKLGRHYDDAPLVFRKASVDLLSPTADIAPLIVTALALPETVGLIVVDTLSRAMVGGDENASTDMGALIRHLDRIRQATGAHVMAVHHSGKDAARGARGHSSLRAATDTEIELSLGQIVVTKQRDIDKSFTSAFALDVVHLGQDADGDPVTSCVVRLTHEIEATACPPTPAEKAVFDALVELATGDAESEGFDAQTITDILSASGRQIPATTVRTELQRLLRKSLVRKIRRGIWAPRTKQNACFVEANETSSNVASPSKNETSTCFNVFE